jgi:hypothetical protein
MNRVLIGCVFAASAVMAGVGLVGTGWAAAPAKPAAQKAAPAAAAGAVDYTKITPLTNDTWVYDGDDDTLFRLVTLGSDELQKNGYMRKGRENVVGPMPPMGTIIKTSDDLWKILVFVRTKYSGDPKYKFGTPESEKAPSSD